MFQGKREKKDFGSEDSFKSSRFNYMVPANPIKNEQDGKYASKNQMIDNINSKLAINFNQIVEHLRERKGLLLLKMERMYEDNDSRIAVIYKGRLQDLKNQAKQLRDQNIVSLVQNTEKLSNTKIFLKKIIEQHNFSQFENMEKIKGKKYFDKLKEAQNDLSNRVKKYSILIEQLQKHNEKQRGLFYEIEQLQAHMVGILKKKEPDYLRRADQVQEQIERCKAILKDNKAGKDKKKKEIEIVLTSIVETLHSHENYTVDRNGDLDNLFGGSQSFEDFQRFLLQFENIVETKVEDKRDERKQKAHQQLLKIANSYEAYIQQLHKQRQTETVLLQDVMQGLKDRIKIALIQKLYFQEISNDRGKLNQVLKKCKAYRNLLAEFEGQRLKLNKELSKINQMKNIYFPKLKSIASEEMRREDLKKQLTQLIIYQNQLEKLQRRYKQHDYITNGYLLSKQTIEREMDELAQKGNLIDYKQKLKDLDKVEKDLQVHKQSVSANQYHKLQSKLNIEAQNLHSKYHDLINPILVEDEQMSIYAFISKLSKRLTLI